MILCIMDSFNAQFENTSFQTDGLRRIRWGVFLGNDGKPRTAAFLVNLYELSLAGNLSINFEAEAERVVKTDEALNGPIHQAYEWSNGHFENVASEDQDWFKFI